MIQNSSRRFDDFDSYEEYYGKNIFRNSFRLSLFGLGVVAIYILAMLVKLGLSVQFAGFLFAYCLATVFVLIMMLFMTVPRFRGIRMPGIIISGNTALAIMISYKILAGASLFGVLHLMIIFMFGVILVAPLLKILLFLIPNILVNALIAGFLLYKQIPLYDLSSFLFISLSLTLFLLVILYNQRRTAKNMYEIAKQNWLLSTKDGLSGLLNRRAWLDSAQKKYNRIRLDNREAAFIMVDIDHFKKVNDTWGHACGDEVIKSVSRVILENCRDTDIIGRLGGEEFGILLDTLAYQEAHAFAERIREAVSQTLVCYGGTVIHVTISLGLAVGIPLGFDDLMRQGDDCLYSAKLTGRNRVIGNIHPIRNFSIQLPLQVLWRDDFTSGNTIIDGEHRTLLEDMNDMFTLVLSKDESSFEKRFEQIRGKIEEHFASEEEILLNLGYDELNNHRECHREALGLTSELFRIYKENNSSTLDVVYTLYKEVVLGHMLVEDSKYFPLTRRLENVSPDNLNTWNPKGEIEKSSGV